MMKRTLTAIALGLLVSQGNALPTVVDLQPTFLSQDGSQANQEALWSTQAPPQVDEASLQAIQRSLENFKQMDFPSQIQALRQQIQSLQGDNELLQHEVASLKKQLNSETVDLDHRLALLEHANDPSQQVAPKVSNISDIISAPSKAITPEEQDKRTYQAAYGLVEARSYAQAIEAFQAYLSIYQDQGRYSANAHYWLGELFALNGESNDAVAELQTVINAFPQSNKVADALLKLGVVYRSEGEVEKATLAFNDVIARFPNSSSARLAQAELEKH